MSCRLKTKRRHRQSEAYGLASNGFGACLGGNFLASSAGEAYDVRTRSPNREFRLNSAEKGKTMLRTIVIILLVLFLLGALPSWPYSAHWGYYPSGGLGFLLIVVIILIVADII